MSVDDVITSGNVTNLASLIGEILSRDDNRVAIGANDTFKGNFSVGLVDGLLFFEQIW